MDQLLLPLVITTKLLITISIGKFGKIVLQNRYLIGAKCAFCSLGKSWRQDF